MRLVDVMKELGDSIMEFGRLVIITRVKDFFFGELP